MSGRMVLPTLLSVTPFLVGAPLSAQGAWSKVPPIPKACYSGQDSFLEDAAAAKSELEGEIEKQEQINKGIVDQVFKMDQAALQQRMMAAVQKDPARSQEIMQAMQSMGTPQGQGAAAPTGPEEDKFQARKATFEADYRAEYTNVLNPLMNRAKNNTATRGALAEFTKQYESELCPRWFQKQATELLASYRAYLEQRIPPQAQAERTTQRMPEMLGFSTKEFRPIAELKAVTDYLRFASDLFGQRDREPRTAP